MTDATVISDAVVEAALAKFWPHLSGEPAAAQRPIRNDMRAAITAAVLAEREECRRIGAIAVAAAIRAEREACAQTVDNSLCDVAEDEDLFVAHRDYFSAAIRARSTGGET